MADPWDGATLEWSIPSPPQEFNFPALPTVYSRDPLWEQRRTHGEAPEPRRMSGEGIHLPNPSFWPIVTALGIAVFFVGFLLGVNLWVILTGGGIAALGIFAWAFEPAG